MGGNNIDLNPMHTSLGTWGNNTTQSNTGGKLNLDPTRSNTQNTLFSIPNTNPGNSSLGTYVKNQSGGSVNLDPTLSTPASQGGITNPKKMTTPSSTTSTSSSIGQGFTPTPMPQLSLEQTLQNGYLNSQAPNINNSIAGKSGPNGQNGPGALNVPLVSSSKGI